LQFLSAKASAYFGSMKGLVLSLAVFALLPTSSGTARSTAAATVRVPDTTPFVVWGSRFQAREKVRVVAQVEGRHVKTVVATATGVFTARFPDVSVRGCTAYIVRATGSKGSYAYLRHLPACPTD
jgi:hypothetical protein